jgi:hypothetical protein
VQSNNNKRHKNKYGKTPKYKGGHKEDGRIRREKFPS